MTLEYSHKSFIKVLALLLVVCLLVSCGLSFKADAAAPAVGALIAVGAAGVIGSILIAMGISPGSSNSDFNSIRSNLITHLSSLGYITSDGNMNLSILGSGLSMVGSRVIDAIRDYLFTGDSSFSAPLIFTAGHICNNNVASFVDSRSYAYYCYTFVNGYVFLDFSDSPISVSLDSRDDGNGFSLNFHSSTGFYLFYSHDSGESFIYNTYVSWTVISHGSVYDSGPTYQDYGYGAKGSYHDSDALNTNNDINILSDGLNPSSTIDVIYPGWDTGAINVDTNIDVVADSGTGAIDGVITADKYYPISVPLDITDVYDWTQEYAQTGTKEQAISATKDDVKDETKESSDSFELGGASDYTFQVKDFFPFCIPFDIYDLLNCLAADPEAPSFDWKIPVLGQDNIVHVDLAQFNTVASILRTMELLAFCVGLAFATKHLIQGGD